MEKVKVVKHSDISKEEKITISSIKSAFGEYSIESQLSWMDNNLNNDDLHFLLYDDEKLIAYLNLISISITINNNLIKGLGVGNVCSNVKGKGYGKKLMKELGRFLSDKNIIGLLFCKKELIDFYLKFNWTLIDKNKVDLSFDNNDIETMIFNFNQNINRIEFTGKSF